MFVGKAQTVRLRITNQSVHALEVIPEILSNLVENLRVKIFASPIHAAMEPNVSLVLIDQDLIGRYVLVPREPEAIH